MIEILRYEKRSHACMICIYFQPSKFINPISGHLEKRTAKQSGPNIAWIIIKTIKQRIFKKKKWVLALSHSFEGLTSDPCHLFRDQLLWKGRLFISFHNWWSLPNVSCESVAFNLYVHAWPRILSTHHYFQTSISIF